MSRHVVRRCMRKLKHMLLSKRSQPAKPYTLYEPNHGMNYADSEKISD